MQIIFHSRIYADLALVIDHYIQNAGQKLADEFFEEFEALVEKIAERPESFAIMEHNIRRDNLIRFPYNVLFYRRVNNVKIMAIRHNSRHPLFGTRRR